MHRLELVPSHNENAGRSFPLTLGRCELAKWWWKACPCSTSLHCPRSERMDANACRRRRRRHTHSEKQPIHNGPCQSCRTIASFVVKLLSKKMLYISSNATMVVAHTLSHVKNAKLLWYNDKPMLRQQHGETSRTSSLALLYDTAILLQPGDTIAIGYSPDEAWMKFQVKRITTTTTAAAAAVVTPDAQLSRKRKGRQVLRHEEYAVCNRLKSRRQLQLQHDANGRQHESSDATNSSSSSSSESASFDTQQTDNGHPPVQGEINESQASSSSTESTRPLPRIVKMTPRRLIVEPQGERQAGTTPTTNHKDEGQPRHDDDDDDKSDATSLLSLPKCPTTWDDDYDQESNEQDEHDSPPRRRERLNHNVETAPIDSQQRMNHSRTRHANLVQHATRRHKQAQDDSSLGTNIVFASALSLDEWKSLREQQDHASRVRRALASLMIAQRTKGDSTWFPTILEGTVVEETELSPLA